SLSYKNEGEGSARKLHADVALKGVSVTKAGGPMCFLVTPEANLSGGVSFKGLGKEGQVGVYMSPATPLGVYVKGEESKEEANRPRLEAEAYPATIAGEQDSANK